MDIGALIVINLSTIPFIHEAEAIAEKKRDYPTAIEILALRNTRDERWLKLYAIFMAILLAITFAPAVAKGSHPVTLSLLGSVLSVQAVLWALVFLKIRKLKHSSDRRNK